MITFKLQKVLVHYSLSSMYSNTFFNYCEGTFLFLCIIFSLCGFAHIQKQLNSVYSVLAFENNSSCVSVVCLPIVKNGSNPSINYYDFQVSDESMDRSGCTSVGVA